MSKSKIVKVNEKIAGTVADGFHRIEDGVVGAYKKVEDKFAGSFLAHEGESVEEAKERLNAEQADCIAATSTPHHRCCADCSSQRGNQ